MAAQTERNWWKRVGWLILIWGASVAALALVAAMLKLAMRGIGMTS
jgi:hypothetical protein